MAVQASSNGDHRNMVEEDSSGGSAWLSRPQDSYTFAILGDLHLEPGQMELWHDARAQVVRHVTDSAGRNLPNACIFQLGDVGGYKSQPGSRACFERALEFMNAFGVPRISVLGNHDLEGSEFETDEENLAVWQSMFEQNHFWAVEHGKTVCIGLSTVRFREASFSCHEVYVDPEQVQWLRSILHQYRDRPVFVFTHAPPMGSGLTSLQEVHVRNRCAWLNHSNNPQTFLEIVKSSPQIKLWFSGHYHLSHDYEGSVSLVNNCLFVQTGVMGACHRDGRRHSRLVRGDNSGYELYTLDHGTGELRLDVQHSYAGEPDIRPKRMWCSSLSLLAGCPGGGAFSAVMPEDMHTETGQSPPILCSEAAWYKVGDAIFASNANQLVQYDVSTRAPVGVVCPAINKRDIRWMTDEQGQVAAIELHPSEESRAGGQCTGFERIEKNEEGGFWQVYQFNKWQMRRQQWLLSR